MFANTDNIPLSENIFRSVQIALPAIKYKNVEQIGVGINRRVYRVFDGQMYWVISTARSTFYSGSNSFEQEVKLLNHLQNQISSGITPQDAQLIESQDGYFAMIYQYIDGRNLNSIQIPDSKIDTLAVQIADFFHQLHSVSIDNLTGIDIALYICSLC